MPELTICIPIAPYHAELAERAIRSAAAQTVPCEVLTMIDEQRRGPGWCRNRMLDEVTTEFVTFLDADDEIMPTFAEETIAQYRSMGGGKYIFTDWVGDDGIVTVTPLFQPDYKTGNSVSKPGAKPYCGGTWHAITTLIPTLWVKAIGGFDEQLAAVEDCDFYMKMCVTMHCGHHLGRPLFHYSSAGKRAAGMYGTLELDGIMQTLSLRYGGKVGCCGNDDKPMPPIGEKQPGDVLAMALWAGNQSKMGLVSGRHYPRISLPKTCWIDPRDALKNPEWWRIIEQPKVDALQTSNLAQIAAGVNAMIIRSPYAPPQNEPPVPAVNAAPNVSRVVRLAQKAIGLPQVMSEINAPPAGDIQWQAARSAVIQAEKRAENSILRTNVPHINNGVGTNDPIFVFSEKPYPSYTDIRRLVELSGFKSITLKQIDAFSKQPYIIVTPEPIGDIFRGIPARVICWQLEYAGDYTGNYSEFGGEVWASDKSWADAHSAKYVLMGSHPDLPSSPIDEGDYDITMLAYMTPRRQAIKAQLADLNWTPDYPGHGTTERDRMLWSTRLMLHVHQHENAPFVAPQRFAIAAAYKMQIMTEGSPGLGDLEPVVNIASYEGLAGFVRDALVNGTDKEWRDSFHNLLCIERPFRRCVEEALKI